MKKLFQRITSVTLVTILLFSIFEIPITADAASIEDALQIAISIANDNSHGYSQENRWGPDYDCSSFVITCLKKAGFNVGSASYTGDMRSNLTNNGFSWIPWSQIGNSSNLIRGDILLNDTKKGNKSKHTEFYLGNGKNVGSHQNYGNKQSGDQDGREISVASYYDHPWDGVLRLGSIPIIFPGPEDTSYAVPVSLKAKQKGNTYDNNGNVESNRWIDAGDNCYIEKVYINGFCYVKYPTSSGERWAYAKASIFSIPKDETTVVASPNSVKLKKGTQTHVSVSFHGNDIQNFSCSSSNDDVCVANASVDWNSCSANLTLYGKNAGTCSVNISVKNSSGSVLTSTIISVEVIDDDPEPPSAFKGNSNETENEFYAMIQHPASSRYLQNFDNNVVLAANSDANDKAQLWRFKRNSDSSYTIYSVLDNTVIDSYGATIQRGSNIQTYNYKSNDNANQKWYIINYNNSVYLVSDMDRRRVIDVTGGGTDANTNIELYSWNLSSAQQFRIVKLGDLVNVDAFYSRLGLNHSVNEALNTKIDQGKMYEDSYFWSDIYYTSTGTRVDTIGNLKFSIKLEVYNPDGTLATSREFQNIGTNLVGFKMKKTGIYKGKCTVSGNIKNSQVIEHNALYNADFLPSKTDNPIDMYIFDARYYASRNQDVYQKYGMNPDALYRHWKDFGIHEGRSASPYFDFQYYRDVNPDLDETYGNDENCYDKLYEHFINFGINELRNISPVYNPAFYQSYYKDELSKMSGKELLDHFFVFGTREGRIGSRDFNPNMYLMYYRDVNAAADGDKSFAYFHYMCFGRFENRYGTEPPNKEYLPSSVENPIDLCIFDAHYYALMNKDVVDKFGTSPDKLYWHWKNFGISEARSASPYFDINYYREKNPDVSKWAGSDNKKIYEHFVNYGINECRDISPVVDLLYYRKNNTDLSSMSGEELLRHFVVFGANEGRKASSHFDPMFYITNNPDVKKEAVNMSFAYFHYMCFGRYENRAPVPNDKYNSVVRTEHDAFGEYNGYVGSTYVKEAIVISYNLNGANEAIEDQTEEDGKELKITTIKPTKEGYTFLGWSTNSVASTVEYQSGDKYLGNGSATLYAVWTPNKYTISYNMNGGNGTIANQTKTYGQDLTLSTTIPTRDNYGFAGWSTSSNATTAQYQAGSKYTTNSSAALYAVWTPNKYTISYNMNGGNGTIANQTKTYGQDLKLSSTIPTKTGYSFLGWSTSSSATTAQYQAGSKYTANIGATLYAVWKANSNYTISYNMNGGIGSISNQTKIQGQEITISGTIPTRPDYLFIGWSTDKNATTAQYQPGSKYTNDSSVTLYAVWKINHSYTTKVIAPTCTEQGYTLHTCANCGDSYKDTYTAAVGHKYVESVIAPTESAQGYTLHTCSVCGDSYKDNYTDVLKPDDPNAPQIVVDNKTIGSGKEVIVSVSLKNNPGIMALKFNVSYDSNVMTIVNAESVGINALYSQRMTDNPFVVSWESGDHDIDTNGEIVKLTFMVNENANEGTYPITITYDEDNIYNLKEENIHFDVVNGSVTVSEYLPGDINNDGKVNMKDLTRLHQYINGWDVTVNESAKDVNGDGKVNMKDLTRLHQFINGWDVTIY